MENFHSYAYDTYNACDTSTARRDQHVSTSPNGSHNPISHLSLCQVAPRGSVTSIWSDSDGILHSHAQERMASDLAHQLVRTLDTQTLDLLVKGLQAQRTHDTMPTTSSISSVPYHKGRWAEPKKAKFVGVPHHKGRWAQAQSTPSLPTPICRPARSRSNSTSSTVSSIRTPVTPARDLIEGDKERRANEYYASVYQGPPILNKMYPRMSQSAGGDADCAASNPLLAALLAGVSRVEERTRGTLSPLIDLLQATS